VIRCASGFAAMTDNNHPAGIDNPNKFFVFAFDDVDLPNLVPQRIKPDDKVLCLDPRGGIARLG
jgi:hypothetical protein